MWPFKKTNDIKRLFIFANNRQTDYKDLDKFLYYHPDYNSNQSVCVFFNEATKWSLKQKSAMKAKRKWLIVRPAQSNKYRDKPPEFLGLEAVDKINFERFYICPELITSRYNRTELLSSLYEYFEKNNIDIRRWRHFKYSFNGEHIEFEDKLNEHIAPAWRDHPKCFEATGERRRTPTTGLWFYIYLKNEYPDVKLTLLYFTSETSTSHGDDEERAYFLNEIKTNKNIELFNSFL